MRLTVGGYLIPTTRSPAVLSDGIKPSLAVTPASPPQSSAPGSSGVRFSPRSGLPRRLLPIRVLLPSGGARVPMNFLSLVLLLCLSATSAFVASPQPSALALRPAAAAATPVADVFMGTGRGASRNKKAKAAVRKMKSNRSAVKRFKVTATGKLLRHYAGKAHLLRKKRPQHLAKLRRVGQCNDAELDTYQRLLLVFPKKK